MEFTDKELREIEFQLRARRDSLLDNDIWLPSDLKEMNTLEKIITKANEQLAERAN